MVFYRALFIFFRGQRTFGAALQCGGGNKEGRELTKRGCFSGAFANLPGQRCVCVISCKRIAHTQCGKAQTGKRTLRAAAATACGKRTVYPVHTLCVYATCTQIKHTQCWPNFLSIFHVHATIDRHFRLCT